VTVLEEQLPASFRRGLEALRARVYPAAAVVAIEGNFAFIDVGVAPVPAVYEVSEARLFARVPLDVLNAEPYGVITIPFLKRRDDQRIAHQHLSHATAKPIEDLFNVQTGFWSWGWKNMPAIQDPEQLAVIYEWAWKAVREI
jgi:hypothetical protein